jgi:hypothetical protein
MNADLIRGIRGIREYPWFICPNLLLFDLAYVAGENDRWFVVVGGQREPDYDAIARGNPIFSSDGTRIAYAAYTQNKWLVIVDGRPERLYIDN